MLEIQKNQVFIMMIYKRCFYNTISVDKNPEQFCILSGFFQF